MLRPYPYGYLHFTMSKLPFGLCKTPAIFRIIRYSVGSIGNRMTRRSNSFKHIFVPGSLAQPRWSKTRQKQREKQLTVQINRFLPWFRVNPFICGENPCVFVIISGIMTAGDERMESSSPVVLWLITEAEEAVGCLYHSPMNPCLSRGEALKGLSKKIDFFL